MFNRYKGLFFLNSIYIYQPCQGVLTHSKNVKPFSSNKLLSANNFFFPYKKLWLQHPALRQRALTSRFPQVLPKLCSTVVNSKTGGGKIQTNSERKFVQNTLLSVIFVKEAESSLSAEQVFWGPRMHKESPRRWKMKETWLWGYAAAPKQSLMLFPLSVNILNTRGIQPTRKGQADAYTVSSLWRSTGTKDWDFSD